MLALTFLIYLLQYNGPCCISRKYPLIVKNIKVRQAFPLKNGDNNGIYHESLNE